MAVSPALTAVRNTYEADGLTNIAQQAAVTKEIAVRSTPALVQLDTDLATKAASIISEKAILDV